MVRAALQYGIGLLGAASLLSLERPAGNAGRYLVHGTDLFGLPSLHQGRVSLLVVMYSINVFLTFTLSQLGMCKHWWEVRRTEGIWLRKFWVNGLGLLLTGTILIVTVTIKFGEGGWVTLLVTSCFIALCIFVHAHYGRVRRALKRLDDTLLTIPFQPNLKEPVPPKKPSRPTAAIIVRDFDGVAIHALLTIPRLFPNHFKNVVFISVGVIDSGQFKGQQEIENLRCAKEEDLKSFVEFANCLGWYAEYRYSLGVDLMAELEELCTAVVRIFQDQSFFPASLSFRRKMPSAVFSIITRRQRCSKSFNSPDST